MEQNKKVQTYGQSEVLKACLEYFDGDLLAASVAMRKYLMKNLEGEYVEKSPEDIHKRLALEFVRIEKKMNPSLNKELYKERVSGLLHRFKKVCPQGSPMSAIGNPYQLQSASNCYVISSPHDSIDGVFKTGLELAQVSKRRGGIGINISTLRPYGSRVNNAAGTSSGIPCFADFYSHITRMIGQNGRCLSGSTEVITENGVRTISEVVNTKYCGKVWTEEGWKKVTNWFEQGTKPVVKVRTKFGYSLTATKDHKISVLDGNGNTALSEIGQLKVKDQIHILRGERVDSNAAIQLSKYDFNHGISERDGDGLIPNFFGENFAYWLGFSYGNGCIIYNDKSQPTGMELTIPPDLEEVAVNLVNIQKTIFGVSSTITNGDGCLKIRMGHKDLLMHMQEWVLLKSTKIEMPNLVINSSPSVQSAFLSGYFDANGDISGREGSDRVEYRYSSTSVQFLESVQRILTSNGIHCKVHKELTVWRLSVSGNTAHTLLIDFLKNSTKMKLMGGYISKADFWTGPYKARALGLSDYMEIGGVKKHITNPKQYMSPNTSSYYGTINKKILNKSLMDYVEAIEDSGEEKTYDITVEGTNKFWANGFYVSNSGALMLCSSVNHPDIERFVKMKQDLTKVTGANVSVMISDEFMRAVESDSMFTLKFPVDSENPKIKKEVKARDLWNTIVEQAWRNAEPGLLFWCTATRRLPSHNYPGFLTIATNPCQPGYATVLTPDGIRTFDDIKIGSIIWSGRQWTTVTNKVMTGIKPVFKYKTSMGEFVGTENHRVISSGERVEASKAETIDVALGTCQFKSDINVQDVMDGLVVGDGTMHKASNDLMLLNIGSGDEEYLNSEISHLLLKKCEKIMVSGLYYEVQTTIEPKELPRTYKRTIPNRFFTGNETVKRGFLRGLFSANGSVVKNGRVRLKQSSFELISQVQMMLSSLGIKSYIVANKPKSIKFSNGAYTPRVSYDLNIASDRFKFAELIGFIHQRKNDKISGSIGINSCGLRPKTTALIKSIEFLEETTVYDITVEAEEHTYWTGGCLVSNCAELLLSAYDSCRLISNNLYGWVKNPFTKDAYFDYDEYFEDTKVAQRMSDGLVELELELVEKIIGVADSNSEFELWTKIYEAAKNGRRTGLGTHGLADCFFALGLKYDSDEAIKTADSIYETHKLASYAESIIMAKERGAFPAFDWELEKNCPFIQELPESYKSDIQLYGRRNIANLTNAPTGSLSIQSQVSSGIESVFRYVYDRYVKKTKVDEYPIDFVDGNGDKWTKFRVIHHTVKQFLDTHGLEMPFNGPRDFVKSLDDINKELIKILPKHFVTSDQIDYLKGVELQATIQKHIDHSVSRTVNLPKGTKKEEVEKVYMMAWKLGLKGITVYVDGSRDGVLLTDSTKEETKPIRPESIVDSHAPKRPKSLTAEIHHTKVKGENWTVIVGLLDSKPYEIFAGKALIIPSAHRVDDAKIIRVASKKYSLEMKILNDGIETIDDLKEIYENNEQRVITRGICRDLRHGIPVEFISKDLQEYEGSMTDYVSALNRVLKKYIKKPNLVAKTCTQCGGHEFEMKEGCFQCVTCGYSKCG